nr:carboxy-terminal kinesin 2-like [Pocillopora verrucosa]XP_058951461.1 carboxy-terminal kinesin 2-like [Pocillopora verrucosa]XP_058951462.1 carboxy-terminal kinesin 2-like [Pocillopora verrucosa]XP_058951463.1 carboxy-terminal kinesin 2-like [Pocillopora verrucosa]
MDPTEVQVRSPLSTQDQNIMANKQIGKPQFVSKLRPPSAVKRPREQAFTKGVPPNCEPASKMKKSSSQTSLKSAPQDKTVTTKSTVSSTLRRQTSASTVRRGTSTQARPAAANLSAVTKRQTIATAAANVNKNASSKGSATDSLMGAKGKKRPAWDYKGRLEDMEGLMAKSKSFMENMTKTIGDNQDRIGFLESLNKQLEGTVQVKHQQTEEASAKIQDLQIKLTSAEEEVRSLQLKHEFEIEVEKNARKCLQREKDGLENDLHISKQEIIALKSTVAKMTADSLGISTELQATKVNLEKTIAESQQKSDIIAKLEDTIRGLQDNMAALESKLRSEETIRRELHNTIQELKGNIRVFCRVRPMLASEESQRSCAFSFGQDERELVVESTSMNETICGNKKAAPKHEFMFDKVFTPSSSQGDVFGEISQLIQSALDGYNVCIFAYGQTGSGKTFTMEGNHGDHEAKGMIPRALEQVFRTSQDLREKGWQYTIEASFLEIYNETIRDLLGSGDSNTKHEIKIVNPSNTGGACEVTVTNVKTVTVTSETQVYSLLEKATQNRAVAATQCNERSSRSHSVFRLKLVGENQLTGEKCQGTLNLIDLAGSERLSQSCSTGERLRETKNINKSLSNLGNVIMALANKEQHIPYRNSKLTFLLQNSLGGNSKSLMFVNISPKEESLQETLCSLRFATKVNQCNIGTAQKKVLK